MRLLTLCDLTDGMERVVCVSHAKVPIVKIWDPELRLACDMNVNNTLALENTRMIRTYVDVDERVRPLAMIVKYWTKRRILNDAGGCLNIHRIKQEKRQIGFGKLVLTHCCRAGWHVKLLYLDLFNHKFSPNKGSPDITKSPGPPSPQTTHC